MKILIVGLGSIGQRHLRILKKVYKKKISIYTLSNSKNKRVIKDNFKSFKVKSLLDYYKIKKIDISRINSEGINIAFICNPPHLHMRTALKLINQNCNLFIEKPLSTEKEIKEIKKIISISKKKKLVVVCGYQFRFHPGVTYIKKIIDKNKMGKVLSGYFHYGEYTGAVKKFEKFENSIYVKKKKGGGALLAFSHHLHLAMYFFGKLKPKYSLLENTNNFKIDVEDVCKLILHDKKNRNFLFNLNFLDTPQENFFIINFKKGSIKWIYKKSLIKIKNYDNPKIKIIKFKNFKRNTMFETQDKDFIKKITNKDLKNKSFLEGYEIIKLINKIKIKQN